ncbi:sensor histidine kinase [Dongia rigui]|uniref:histidine kinase n=1 Tax=Dongia rigui TaxID=940149 RepID=A0ABU5DXJ3_9PROT|nr:histidine kinase dimerization/phosphoacceptor domain -containing protein [Dongia rigui]MDY0872039.1 histidine kinase dimerization/phosphoacceptor domain -containing protein [Dongia rigui]
MTIAAPVHLEAASTLAVIAASKAPLVFMDGNLIVIAVSRSFCTTFRIDPALTTGTRFSDLGGGEWDLPQLSSLLNATASGFAEIDDYEMDLIRADGNTRRLVLNAHKLEYGDADNVRLLLAVNDVTEARAAEALKDDLLREKGILLQEVQHRVANSLQIIASVLMQSARKVQSEEVRGYLQDAQHRVLSIAAVQQQLAASRLGDVSLRPYFLQLCQSLGASMIRDPAQLSIDVTVDDSSTRAETSVSLGLILTELVINALKHAFPNNRNGKISVDYRSKGDGWTLSVADNGVGMPTGAAANKPGLGTGIVEALSRQLRAEMTVTDGSPGTIISVTR